MDAFSFLRRRTFLKLGIAGLAGLGAAGGALWSMRGQAPAVAGLKVLDRHRFATMKAIAEAQLPLESAAVTSDHLARMFDGFLQGEHDENVADLATALLLVEFGPLIFEGRFVTFSHLALEDRRRHWRGWMESELALRRQVALAFRKFLHVVFFDDPKVWPAIGYPGPSLWGMPAEEPTP